MSLPSGFVTFVFTDIEGSTPLLERLGPAYDGLLQRHREILRAAVSAHGGEPVKTEGDGCFFAFAEAPAAAAACLQAQAALGLERWPPDATLRVRIGLHAGEAIADAGDYISLAVNVAARICDAAHGGQVLASEEVAGRLGPESSAYDLGLYRLRGARTPLRLFQLQPPPEPRRSFGRPRPPHAVRESELLERASELGVLTARVDALATAGTGGTVLIEGVPGIGKSALLQAAVADARARDGVSVLTARGTELDLGLAFGGVRQLFGGVPALAADDRERVLAGPANLSGAVLGLREAPAGELADPLYALYWLTMNLAEQGPMLLAIDDLHWLDAESARFVAYLAQRLEGLPVLLMGSVRPREPGASRDGLDDLRAVAERISPAPLTAAAAAAIVGGVEDAEAVHRVTGGNPFLLGELARAIERAPDAALDELEAQAVAESVSRRIGRISPQAVAMADAVALFPAGARLEEAAAVADLTADDAARAADALIDAQVLVTDGSRLEFLHPLMRSALYAALGTFVRRRRHALAAGFLRSRGAPVEQIAAHLLAGAPAEDPENVRILRAAADAALDAVAPRAAIRYLQRALEEGAAEPPERRRLLLDLGRCQRLIGNERSQATLVEAVEASRGTPDHAEAAIELAATAFANGDVGAVRRTVDAARAVDLPAEQRMVLEMLLAEALWADVEFEASIALIDTVPADLPGDTPAQRMALGLAGAVRLMRCDPIDEVVAMLRRSVGPDGTAPGPVAGIDVGDPLQWLIVAEALDDAQALAEERMEHARATGDEALFAGTQNAYGWLLSLRGDLPASVAAYRIGLAQPALPMFMRAHLAANLAETLIWQGEFDAALAEMDALPSDLPGHPRQLVDTRRAEVAFWRGDFPAALPSLEQIHDVASRAAPEPHPNTLPLTADYAESLAATGRREDGLRLVTDLIARSERVGARYGTAVFTGSLARLTDDLAAFERTVELAAPTPYRWHEARARLDLGAALRRAGRRVDAREHLRHALDYAERNGVIHFAARARDELRLAGARPRRAVLSGADSLTPAEARIARLAAEGRSNKEIAQHLFLTVKTVEMNLVRAYRKLDISSRKDLPAALVP